MSANSMAWLFTAYAWESKSFLDSVGMLLAEQEEVCLCLVTEIVPMLAVVLLDLAPGL